MRGEVEIAACIVEPCSTAPSWRETFEHKALCFSAARWEDPRLIGREIALAHVDLPFPGSALLAREIAAAPGVVAGKCNVVAGFQKAVLVP